MDKELLRIVIIATGLIIITGMLTWAFIKNSKRRRSLEEFDDETPPQAGRHARALLDDDDFLGALGEGDDDILTAAPAASNGAAVGKPRRYQEPESDVDVDDHAYDNEEDREPEPRFVAPSLIQFTLVANRDEGFNGLDLAHAFEIVDLEYGNLKIYERLDSKRLVDFGVASMLPPGTFPERNLETYYCPGIVFFMQPGELDDAVSVFDDFVRTAVFMATELDGTVLDHQRNPLTETTVELIRRSL